MRVWSAISPDSVIMGQLASERQEAIMNARQQKGLTIAALIQVKRKGNTWVVPSQFGSKDYKVEITPESLSCTCPDFQSHKTKCKHVYAVEFVQQREQGVQIAHDRQITEIAGKAKSTYCQNWPVYNKAQKEEKHLFQVLLHELTSSIQNPPQPRGKPRMPLGDMIFACAVRVYSTLSGRRAMGDLKDAFEKGYLSKLPSYNVVFKYFESERLTPYLHHLIAQAALPLQAVETDFAPDSSGFRTQGYVRWFNARYGHEQENHDWLKAHIVTGTKTNIITAVEISDRQANDGPFFDPLIKQTAENFTIKEVSADKAYSSRHNLRLVTSLKAAPYIAFKDNAIESGVCEVWDKLFHYYSLHKEEFMAHFHKQSNVESTFWMVKSKFGEEVRSKLPVAQINEVLSKILCHNICCVIQSMFELGIEADFWKKPSAHKSDDLPTKEIEPVQLSLF
jgi:transposase